MKEEFKILDKFMESKGLYISYKDGWGGEYWGEYKTTPYLNWKYIMPVVDKIEKLFETDCILPRFEINSHHAYLSLEDFEGNEFKYIAGCYKNSPEIIKFDNKLLAVYNVCVEFVKWYNKNTLKSDK